MTLKTLELPPGLYLVATPIGNLRDMTQRGIDTLGAVDLILCEDTRVTGKLLQAHGIKAKLDIYNDHSADRVRTGILERIAAGARVALVSDAGTPLISDPGYKLVRDAQDLGLYVTAIPGANAVLSAVQLSGLPSDKFCFLGFLPPKHKARCDILKRWAGVPGTLVVYETGPRLAESLADMAAILGPRMAAVVREITKLYEESRRDTLTNLAAYYGAAGAPKGEIAVVIGPPEEKAIDDAAIREMLVAALRTMTARDAAAHVAAQAGIPRKKAYAISIELTKGAGGG